jgi:hypothetical protein
MSAIDYYLQKRNLRKLEIITTKNVGYFDCSINKLTSLKGTLEFVRGSFDCNHNLLINLKYSPKTVGNAFWCEGNQLTALIYFPKNVYHVSFRNNYLLSLDYIPNHTLGHIF